MIYYYLRKGTVKIIQFFATAIVFGPSLCQEAENERGKSCKLSEASQRQGESPMGTYPPEASLAQASAQIPRLKAHSLGRGGWRKQWPFLNFGL